MPLGGERVGSAYVKLIADGDSVPDDIRDALKKLEPTLRDAGEEHARAYDKGFNKQIGDDEDDRNRHLFASLNKGLGRMEAIGKTLGSGLFDEFEAEFTRRLGDSDLGARMRNLLQEDFARTGSWGRLEAALKDVNGLAARAARSMGDLGDSTDETHNRIVRLHRTFTSFNDTLDHTAHRIGRLAGRGSRNDFIHLFGGIVEGITRVAFSLGKLPSLFTKVFGGDEGGGFKLTTAMASLAVNLTAVAVALAVLGAVAGPLVVAISGLTAAVIGLASSLVFAAGAAGGVALVLGGVLVASIGSVIAAYASLDDAQRKVLSASFKPLIDGAKEFGSAVADSMVPGLERAGQLLEPLTQGADQFGRRIGRALGDVARNFARSTRTPEFRLFQDAFEKFLPNAIRTMGRITTQVIAGIGGIFRAAIPITREFLGWLDDVTARFARFTNSVEGQSKIGDFFDRAAESARQVGDFLGAATEALVTLISAGKDSGDTLFGDMADNLRRFTDYMRQNPDAVKDFFKNGIDVARDLGDIIVTLGRAIGTIDTPENRKVLSWLVDAFNVLVKVMAVSLAASGLSFDALSTSLSWLGARLGKIDDLFKTVGRVAQRVANEIRDQYTKMLATVVVTFARILQAGVTRFVALREKASELVSDIAGFFRRLPARISSALGDLVGRIVGKFERIKDRISEIPGQIVDLFSGLGQKILDAIGSIDIGSLIKVPGGAIGGKIYEGLKGLVGQASGGINYGPTFGWTGEAGPEAIVPLNRPLSQVDPSVRWLSAIAQGQTEAPARKGVDASGWTIVTPTSDAKAVATEVVNTLIARAM